jgi:uncharacterized membrane protein YkoI
MLMSLRAYARYRGCALRSVQFAIARGRIRRNANGLIDSEEADRDWAANTLHSNARPGPRQRTRAVEPASDVEIPLVQLSSSKIAGNLAPARAAKEVFEARLKRIELEERQGNLVYKGSVQIDAFNRARILRDAILNVPDRLSASLAAESDTAVVRDLLETELVRILEQYPGGSSDYVWGH